jgi:hypothetical protein
MTTTPPRRFVALVLLACAAGPVVADTPPVASYIFPAGGQRGTTVPVRVGGLNLYRKCGFELVGPGVSAPHALKPTGRVWFEGPLLPMPESQQGEDYPVDMLGSVAVAKDAAPGVRRGRVWTSQGAAGGLAFVVGDLPEVVERETDGDPIPEPVTLPVTANGRIFPREDIDLWAFPAKKGQTVSALATTTGIHSPLVARLEIVDARGTVLAESGSRPALGCDASVSFTAPADGTYHVRVRDAANKGGPAFVYRLTITTAPTAAWVYPLGGKRGEKLRLFVNGGAKPIEVTIPADAPDAYRPNLEFANPVPLDVTDLPDCELPQPDGVTAPAVLNGRIREPGGADVWRVKLKKGMPYRFDLLAQRAGSPLCGVIAVSTTSHEAVQRSTSVPAKDPQLTFTPPADGVYTLTVSERFRTRGGPEFVYRLRVLEQPAADFRLTLPVETLNVPRGGTAKLTVGVERLGTFRGPIEIALDGLPPGVTAPKATVAEGKTTAEVVLTADKAAKVAAVRVRLIGTAAIDGKPAKRTGTFGDLDHVLLAVAVPTPFKFGGEYTMNNGPRGQEYKRAYKLDRNGFDGPVVVRLSDKQLRHLQGVTADPVVVPAGVSEFEFPCRLPPLIEIGRTCRVQLLAEGVVKDADGAEHTVGFTSTEQNHQMIVVPEPGRLGVELGRSSVAVVPGGAVTVPVRVSRAKGLTGPVVVELVVPAHWRGVSVPPVTIPAERTDGELVLSFDPKAVGPFNMPATVRATLGDRRSAVVAEGKLELATPVR